MVAFHLHGHSSAKFFKPICALITMQHTFFQLKTFFNVLHNINNCIVFLKNMIIEALLHNTCSETDMALRRLRSVDDTKHCLLALLLIVYYIIFFSSAIVYICIM